VVADAAYARCLHLAQQHYENFPVASRLLPASARPDIAAIYAFARIADDFADEGTRTAPARIALLDDWHRRLRAAAEGRPIEEDSDAGAIFLALAETMRRRRLEVDLFEDLLSAFRQDVLVHRYDTWADVLDYCRRSANPVGRLVLRVCGYRDERLDAWSDAVCTALQLTNFWQDFERDWRNGRLYVPKADVIAAGAKEDDLGHRRLTPEWEAALSVVAARTRDLFAAGRPVADHVRGRLKWELRATWLGGVRILDRLAANRFDVFKSRPALGWPDAALIGWRALVWRRVPVPERTSPAVTT
jgi:squalene synthase HpnC